MNPIVHKYGGQTVSSPEKIKSIAKNIAQLHRQGEKIIVVVSAMGTATDDLLTKSKSITKSPDRRELDVLMSAGERISMSLLAMALIDQEVPAISFTGSQAGILTSNFHTRAEIAEIRPIRVEEELKKSKVVIIAGFQGVSPESKDITTLGRGGSDLTAVAMANHFNSKSCSILKDVPGVFSIDPKMIEKPEIIPEVSYDQLSQMAFWGAQVIYYRAIDLAAENRVPLYIGPSDPLKAPDQNEGTRVVEESPFSQNQPIAINTIEFAIAIPTLEKQKLEDLFTGIKGCPIPSELVSIDGVFLGYLSKKEYGVFEDNRETIAKHFHFEDKLSCISVTFSREVPTKDNESLIEALDANEIDLKYAEIWKSTAVYFIPRYQLIEAVHLFNKLIFQDPSST